MSWNKIVDNKPLAYKTGEWDGLKSDELFVATSDEKYHVAVMYSGILDGSEFCDFYDDRDFEISNVAYWKYVDSPFL